MKRWPTGASSRSMRSAAELPDEREPGDERADDRRELCGVGELGERQRERERERDERAGRARVPVEELEEAGREASRRATAVSTRNATATSEDAGDVEQRDRAFGDEAHDDREDHEAEHVVGDGGAQHRARLDRGERAEVAEDARGDPDARRRERGAEEQRLVVAVPERGWRRGSRPPSARPRPTHATAVDARPTAPSSPRSISMPTPEQEQDDAELAEHGERLVRSDERRAPRAR